MKWKLITEKLIRHHTGFQIELVRGTWQNPIEVMPFSPDEMSQEKAAHLLREALIYVSQHPNTETDKKPSTVMNHTPEESRE